MLSFRWKTQSDTTHATRKKSVKGSLELGNGETQSKALCGCKQSERVALPEFLNAIHVLTLLLRCWIYLLRAPPFLAPDSSGRKTRLLKRLARSPFQECPRKIVIGLPQWSTPLWGRRFYSGWHNGHSEEGHILRIILVGTSGKTGRVAHNTALPAGHEANTGKGSEEEISEQRISSFPNPLWPLTYFFFPGQKKVTYCCPGDIRRDAYKGFLSQVSFFYIEFTKDFSI